VELQEKLRNPALIHNSAPTWGLNSYPVSLVTLIIAEPTKVFPWAVGIRVPRRGGPVLRLCSPSLPSDCYTSCRMSNSHFCGKVGVLYGQLRKGGYIKWRGGSITILCQAPLQDWSTCISEANFLHFICLIGINAHSL
jgi:hypothetical protein